jgi:hypothetical protein
MGLMFLMMAGWAALVIVLATQGLPFTFGIYLIILAMLFNWLLDIFTVRLVVAGRCKGLFGYET